MIRGQIGILSILMVAVLLTALPAQGGNVREHRLPNGVTVLTMPGEWNRIVAITAVVDAGSKHDPPKLRGLANLTNSMLLQGTTTRSAQELAELVDSAGLQVGTETSWDGATVYATAIDSEFDLALEAVADVLQRPAFDESRLLDAQRAAYQRLEDAHVDPLKGPLDRVTELIFGEHPYAFQPYGTESGIERITPSHLIRFHSERYVGESTVISIVGNFDEKSAVRQLTDLLSDYPNKRAEEADLPEVSAREIEPAKVFKDVDRSYLAMAFVGPAATHPDYAAFEVMDSILGMGSGSRLARALGDDGAGLSDKAGAFCRCGLDVAALVIYAATEDADAALGIIESEVDRISNDPVSGDELDTAKNRIIGKHVIQGQTNLVRAARLAGYELAGLGIDYGDSFLEAVNRVDKDDILRVASEWLVKPATVVVQPGKTAPTRGRKRAGI